MALIISDRVKETSITSGTGSVGLTGALGGFTTFASAIGDGNTTYYVIENDTAWEIGIGTYTLSSDTLSRDTVLKSSTGAKINLSGVSFVFCAYPSDRTVVRDESNVLSVTQPLITHDTFNSLNTAGVSGLLTLRQLGAGNFFHAYVDDSNDKTISLYSDATSSPDWKFGLKDSPSNSGDPPTYAYVYASDGTAGIYSNSQNSINLTHGGGFNVVNKGNTLFTTDSDTGFEIYSFAASQPVFQVRGTSAQSADLQQWQNNSSTVLAKVDSDGDLTARSFAATDGYSTGSGVLFFDANGTITANTELIWNNSNGRLGVGTDDPDYELDVDGNIGLNQYIYHNGDTDTYIRFRGDQIDLVAGGRTMLTLDEAGQDACVVNTGGQDIDFRVEGENDVNLIFADAENDMVGIGTSSPSYKLDVVGHNAWVQASGFIVGNSGVVLANNAPSVTTNTLYNTGGVLYFNGARTDAAVSGWAKGTIDGIPSATLISGALQPQITENTRLNSASGVAVSGWALGTIISSGVAVSGWAKAYVDTQDHSAIATSGWALGTIISSGVAVSGWAKAYVDSQDHTGGGGSSTDILANTASGVAISGWALQTIISSGVAVSGWAKAYVDTQDHSAIATSGWALGTIISSGVAVSGWAKAYVDTQDHSAIATSGWALGTIISSGVAVSGWAKAYVDSQDHTGGGGSSTDILANTASGVAISGWALQTIISSGVAVSGWAKAYVDTQDHSAIATSGWALGTIISSGVAVSGWAAGVIAGQDHTGTAVSGWAKETIISSGVAVSGWAKAYVDTQDHSAIATSGWALGTIISSGVAVSGWAKAYVDTQDHSAIATSGWALGTIISSGVAVSGWAAGSFGAGGGMTSFQLEDGDGTEVTVSDGKEVKFVEGAGIDIDWTDTDNGTDGDPYDLTFTIDHDAASNFVANEHIDHTSVTLTAGDGLSGGGTIASNRTFAVEAAQTTITSILATDLKIGEDNETKIDFETVNEIHFYASNAEQVYLADGIFGPQTDSDVDLGTTSVRWKDAYVDTITTTSDINCSGEVRTSNIGWHDGDNAMTIANGGLVTFAAGFAVGSDAEGDTLYHNGTSYVRLAKGTDNHVLTMDGNVPNWEAAAGGGVDAANGVNNRVATFTDADSLNGEANLTFDGSNLVVNGTLFATVKSFLIDHPTKEGMNLQHGSLEGPENGVYVRGLAQDNIIDLPDYWVGLVDENSITAQLTPKGYSQPNLFVDKIEDNKIYLRSDKRVNAYYIVHATRKDVNPLEVEWAK